MMQRIFLLFLIASLGWQIAPAQQTPAGKPQGDAAAAKTPQAKTHQEFKDYNTAYAVNGGAAMEKAARHFAEKYPDSELKVYLYSKALHEYQSENNPTKILEMGNKVLEFDPDNAIALVLTATVLSDNLSEEDKDADRERKIATIRANCSRALTVVNGSFTLPGAGPEQLSAYRDTLRAMAYSAEGILELKSGNDAAAEQALRSSTAQKAAPPDAYTWYHMALAQDHQKKYSEALASVNHALNIVGSNADLEKLATGERERLARLTGAVTAPPAPPDAGKTPH